MISISGLSKRYGKQEVLKSINLQFTSSECVALIGPNGSGKTTLIKSILSLVLPDAGVITINGESISNNCEYRELIGYMPQMSRLPENMMVDQLFQMIRKGRSNVSSYDEDLYESFQIEEMKNKALGALSGGMRQKVSAALAFLFNPKVLILDEPTSALDPVANEILKDKIRKCSENGKLVLITSHNLNDLEGLIERVVYLMDGEVYFQKSLEDLQSETNKTQLNQIIVRMLELQSGVV